MSRSAAEILADTDDLTHAVILSNDNKDTEIPADVATGTGEPSIDETEQPDIQAPVIEEGEDTTEPAQTADSFLDELQALPENIRKKYLNPDGTPKSSAELLKMHRNAEKLIGASPEKKAEYLQSQEEDTPVDEVADTSYDFVPPNPENERQQIQSLAMSKLRELNISLGLGLEFKDGIVKGFNSEDEAHNEAWEIATATAESIYSITREQTNNQIKPFEEAGKRTAYQSSIQRVISKFDIKGISAKELTDVFVKDLGIDAWKQMSPESREGFIKTEAEAAAYRKIMANAKIVKPAPIENPVTLKSGSTKPAAQNKPLTPLQQSEYDKHCKMMQQQGFLTDNMKATFLKAVKENYPEGGK